MAEQKPQGVSWESWSESLIRQAQADGRFSHLPGEGQPLENLHEPYDELWWARKLLEREQIGFLPEALRVRSDVEKTLAHVDQLDTEVAVRAAISSLNERIHSVNANTFAGPPTTVAPLDVETVVARWRASLAKPTPAETDEPPSRSLANGSAVHAAAFLAASLGVAALVGAMWWAWGF